MNDLKLAIFIVLVTAMAVIVLYPYFPFFK
jgi:hypothetical protein